jgi:hypothetical protein
VNVRDFCDGHASHFLAASKDKTLVRDIDRAYVCNCLELLFHWMAPISSNVIANAFHDANGDALAPANVARFCFGYDVLGIAREGTAGFPAFENHALYIVRHVGQCSVTRGEQFKKLLRLSSEQI